MSRPQKVGGILGLTLLLSGTGLAAILLGGLGEVQAWFAPAVQAAVRPPDEAAAQLVSRDPDILYLPPDLVRALGIRTAPVQQATQVRSLVLVGSLALESDRLARVRARFAGEVVELGTVPDSQPGLSAATASTVRQVQLGDNVQ